MNNHAINSTKLHKTTEEMQRTFLSFREECIWLRCCYNTYADLYESGPEIVATLSATANIFFGDLSRILSEYFCVLACKITDPAKTCGRTNLTVEHMNSLLRRGGLTTEEIGRCSEKLLHYRGLIKTARDRLISHLDREAVLKGEPIGVHTPEDIASFLENLQLYCDAVGRVVGVGPLDFRVSPGSGDAMDLIKILEEDVDARKFRTSLDYDRNSTPSK